MWQVREGLAGSKQFGSTGSVNSAGSDGEVKLAGVHHSSLYQVNCNLLLPYLFLFFSSNLFCTVRVQAAGHHLALHAVHNTAHNTSYQVLIHALYSHNTNHNFIQTNSTLETCLESDEADLEDLSGVQLYDVPRASQPTVKKSNSRVSANGKLSLRVESFKGNR